MRRFLLFLILFSPLLLAAQTANVSGTVRDDEGRALPDVSIAVVGEGSGTTSGSNGG